MVHAHAPMPRLTLDPKRIAANSFAIAIHVAVLMLLFMPAQAPPVESEPEQIVLIDTVRRTPPPPPPPPPVERVVRVTPPNAQPVVQPQQTPIVEEQPTPTDQGTIQAVEEIGPPTTFESGPSVAELRTDVAPPPTYPAMALRRGITGEVLLRVLVDAQGRPVEVTIERSSGSRLLDEAAQKFVRARWHFIPAQQGGVAISAYALVPINFTVDR